MSTRRITLLTLVMRSCLGWLAVASFFLGDSAAQAQANNDLPVATQEAYLHCVNSSNLPSLDVFGILRFPQIWDLTFPLYPQILQDQIVVLTNVNTPAGPHSVIVVNTDTGNNVAVFYFNTLANGAVGPNFGSHVLTTGQSPSGTPYKYLSTITSVYKFAGDNFPLSAWPDTSNWRAPSVIHHMELNLDQGVGWVGTPKNSKGLRIDSEYTYDHWAWQSWLGYEGPYTAGAGGADPPIDMQAVFDLRGSPSTVPPTPGPLQSPDQPYPEPGPASPPQGECGDNSASSGSNPGGSGPGSPSSPGLSWGTPTLLSVSVPGFGMAIASLDRFQAGVAITDTPISYQPGVGKNVHFTLSYHQRLTNQPAAFSYSNLGPQWNGSWISYISGGPTSSQSDAIYHAPDGSQYTYGGYERTVIQGQGVVDPNEGDFQANEGWTHATLHYRQGQERYERWLPDGTVERFAQPAGTFGNRLFFLSSVTDPQGNVTTLNYDSTAAANGQAVLTSVSDPTNSQLIFSYDAANPLRIVKVTRSKDNLSATFHYTNGQLTGIRDTLGITSSFHYISGTSFIDNMTTPYGMTTFSSTDGTNSLEADMTNPLGQTERVEYQEVLDSSFIPDSGSPVPSATGLSFNNLNLNRANSFYWNRRAIADAAGLTVDSQAFYTKAQLTHWAETSLGSIPVPLSTKKPLEGRVWYKYQGQFTSPDNFDYIDLTAANATTRPVAIARLVDTSTGPVTQANFANYNPNGLITQSVDPIGRTTNYSYYHYGLIGATDDNDLNQVTCTNSRGGQDVLSTMANYTQHEPQTIIDAAGQAATLEYNGQGQLISRTVTVGSQNQTTALAYYTSGSSSGYLDTVTRPTVGGVAGPVTTYTYDSSGRVASVMDGEGYTIQIFYDHLDRRTSVQYLDGTTDQTFYHDLDIDHTIDRQGHTTNHTYDAIRELVQTSDPMGQTTKYSWCTCGGLATMTDSNGNVTTWNRDLEGRVTSKIYADSSAIVYVYETNTSRVHTMTDHLHTITDTGGNLTTYSYNSDDTLKGTTYVPASGVTATPNVSFSYDSIYNRITTMTDGTGSTQYYYNSVGTLGAGRLSNVIVPIAGHTAAVVYTYDELGRVTHRTIDGTNPVVTTFDALGRITHVANALTPTGTDFTYAYADTPHPSYRLAGITYPSGTGLSASYGYFPTSDTQNAERLEDITNSQSGTVLSKFDYTYNAAGTVHTWTQQAGNSASVVNTMGYDNDDRLINATQSGGGTASNAYHYDPAGNRLAEVTGNGTTAGQFNSVNWLTGLTNSPASPTVAGYTTTAITTATIDTFPATVSNGTNFSANVPLPTGTNTVSVVANTSGGSIATQRFQVVTTGTAPTPLTYDINGNIITDETGNGYTWDALNRLTTITYSGGATSNFAYDGLSRRISIIEKNSSGAITSTKNYLWVGSEVAEERDSSGITVTKRFFPQGEQQIASGTATVYYYTRDHLGSVREMCSSSGAIVARYNYDPYGRAPAGQSSNLVSGTNLATFQYTGAYFHQASGLSLTLYRAYDPNTGRWLSRDPIGIRGGINPYSYVENDPIVGIDPLGLWTIQGGISANFQAGPININVSVGIVFDSSGQFGVYVSYGYGAGTGKFGFGIGISVGMSDAACIQDLNGSALQTGGAIGGIFIEGFQGTGSHGQTVTGFSLTMGIGGGAEAWEGKTQTQTSPLGKVELQ